MDDKELREKIARWLYYRGKTTGTCNLDYIPKWHEVPDIIKGLLRKEADELLALLQPKPDKNLYKQFPIKKKGKEVQCEPYETA